MGGRGASSGTSRAGNRYGSQYRTLLSTGNVKFIEKNERRSEPIMETMTNGRVYAVIGGNSLKSVVYFDGDNKRAKQIDVDAPHRPFFAGTHTHHGYYHNEGDSPKGASRLTDEEKRMVERLKGIWEDYRSK